jgi:uncharacterized phage protein gp47/JayE
MSYGVTPQGFAPMSLQDIKSELEAEFRSRFGAGINLEPESVFGQVVGIFSEREALLWELAQSIYNADRPDSAAGASLDTLAALTGASRLAATKSTVTGTAAGDEGTVLPAGRVVSVDGSGARFVTLEEVTIPASGSVDVACEAEEFGPVPAYAGTLTVIETPVAGWDSFINAADAVVGRDVETDASFRLRREELLRSQGNSALEALRADVLAVEGVESCTVFENTTSETDADGMPPHSVEVLVQGGDDHAIAEAIWNSVAGGIATHGTSSIVVIDSQGAAREVKFSRPTERQIWVAVNGAKDADRYPADGDEQIKAAIAAAGFALQLGDDVVSSALYPAVFYVSGVIDVTSILIGFAAQPSSSATLPIGTRERAVFDTARITVAIA